MIMKNHKKKDDDEAKIMMQIRNMTFIWVTKCNREGEGKIMSGMRKSFETHHLLIWI